MNVSVNDCFSMSPVEKLEQISFETEPEYSYNLILM